MKCLFCADSSLNESQRILCSFYRDGVLLKKKLASETG
jgi:hypothetical protein